MRLSYALPLFTLALLTTLGLCLAGTAAAQTPPDATGQSIAGLVEKADALIQAGKYDAALQAAQEAVTASDAASASGTDVSPLLVARAYNALGVAQAYKQMPEAEAALRRALSLREQHLGAEHPEVAQSLVNLAMFYRLRGNYQAAEPLYRRALEVIEKVRGPEHPELATVLNNVALFYKTKGDYAAAEPLYRRALEIREKVLGAEHPDVAATSNNLAELYRTQGRYAAAEPLYQRARTIWENTLGKEHPYVATVLNNLALLHKDRGDYQRAEPYFQEALHLRERIFGSEHPEVATAASNLAELYRVRGDYTAAEPLYRRAIAIREAKLGPNHSELAIGLNNAAAMYRDRGDYTTAEPLYRRALDIWEKALGSNHPLVASALNNLGELYWRQDRPDQAQPFFERALRIREKVLGAKHPLVAVTLTNLGAVELGRGNLAAAEQAFTQALSIAKQVLGPNHPLVASILSHLGHLSHRRGDATGAESFYQRSFHIRQQALGAGHPDLVVAADHLSRFYLERGQAQTAGEWLARETELSEADARRNLVVGSERQKIIYAQRAGQLAALTVAWQIRYFPTEATAARLALLTVLRHKGRVLDVLSNQAAVLRQRATAADRALLDDLQAARNRRTQLAGKPEAQAEVTQLEQTIEQLESRLGERFAQLGAQLQAVTLEAVQAALPKGTVLIEYVIYQPLDPARADRLLPTRHLAAYILWPSNHAPKVVDLGELEPIEARLMAFRRALGAPKSKVRPLARALDEKLMAPVRSRLGKFRRLFIAPDGSANLIPFEALVDEHGRYLAEQYDITLLTSGRDLLRLGREGNPGPSRGLVMADPRYDLGHQTGEAPAVGVRSVDFQAVEYPPLPGTRREAQVLQKTFREVEVVVGEGATEARLKSLRAPLYLHIGTHGFFLPEDNDEQTTTEARELGLLGERGPAATGENPLLRSGLILAGVQQGQSGAGEDGVLTALEAAGLNLWGTQLVVLSACETGLGEVRQGEGVYGLRRALVLAGAETQVMSLWKVSDAATAALMGEFYRRLGRGEGRVAALQAARLALLRGVLRPRMGGTQRALGLSSGRQGAKHPADWRHPYYWAAFVISGDWRPLRTLSAGHRVRP